MFEMQVQTMQVQPCQITASQQTRLAEMQAVSCRHQLSPLEQEAVHALR